MDWYPSLSVATVWRGVSVLALCWLAIFFGRTLAPGQVPLIERIARVSDPELSPTLKRYTRLLTALWSAYFVIAALLVLLVIRSSSFNGGAWVGLGSAALFVGEHWLRRRIFPGESFPGLAQQVRDTWAVWHPRKRIPD
ncbi:MAG: hypothetical protein JWQ33_2795 [Ramlibacter sp.]|nr:hypothetical protein [Ramlibacter sp.]